MSRLPALYPDAALRELAEKVLVPQLRSVIAEALSNFSATRGALASVPPSPNELPKLCAEIDKVLAANNNLLDAENLGKPLFDYIQTVRESVKGEMEEVFKEACRKVLAEHGITDRVSLMAFTTVKFIQTPFPPYGKGSAFAGMILGETVFHLSLDYLCRIADKLNLPDLSDETKQKCRDTLVTHGITDRASLMVFRVVQFIPTPFPPYGKGMAFAGIILGETVRSLSLDHLCRIADMLNLPDLSDETKQKCRSALATHGITDRATLFNKGQGWFSSPQAQFSPFGSGRKLLGFALGETVGSISLAHLRRLADKLGWK